MNCEGCKIKNYDLCRIVDSFEVNNIVYKCPCQICLVKGMCNTVCEDFIKYTQAMDIKIELIS